MTLLVRYWRRPRGERALLRHALALHSVVAVLVRLVRPNRASRWLRAAYRQRPPFTGRHEWERIVWAVRTVTGVLPAGNTCLTKAVTAECLLRVSGYDATLRFGVAGLPREGSALRAHAWVEHGGRVVMGGPVPAEYVALLQPGGEAC